MDKNDCIYTAINLIFDLKQNNILVLYNKTSVVYNTAAFLNNTTAEKIMK